MASATGSQISAEMRQCIQLCTECSNICQQTVIHCLGRGGPHAEVSHIRMLLDCAEMCRTSANMMLRESPFAGSVCGVCARICEQCAASCERVGNGDTQMRECADVCHRCADACRRMAA